MNPDTLLPIDNDQSSLSVLRDGAGIVLESKPFPHVVIQNALPQALLDSLIADFPLNEFQFDKNNKRHDISVSSIDNFSNISDEWKRFIHFHSSEYFFQQVMKLFKDHLPTDTAFQKIIDNPRIRVGKRGLNSFEECDILMDAQISINSPITKKSSVRAIHVDHPNKLFSGLLYLRRPEDDSIGGDLHLCSWNNKYSDQQKLKFYKEGVSESHITVEKEIKYAPNVCILFLNSLDALHAVTPRNSTDQVRTFVNLVGELPFDLYQKDNLVRYLTNQGRKFLSYCKKAAIKELAKIFKS